MENKRPWCCYVSRNMVNCPNDAEWDIFYGDLEHESTQSCTEHLGDMMTDAPVHTIYRTQEQEDDKGTN